MNIVWAGGTSLVKAGKPGLVLGSLESKQLIFLVGCLVTSIAQCPEQQTATQAHNTIDSICYK